MASYVTLLKLLNTFFPIGHVPSAAFSLFFVLATTKKKKKKGSRAFRSVQDQLQIHGECRIKKEKSEAERLNCKGVLQIKILYIQRFFHFCLRFSFVSGAPNDNFRKNICSEDDLRSRIFETFIVKSFLACLS